MTYDTIENLIEQINSKHNQIGVEVRSFWSNGHIVDKHESVVWNQNQVEEHNTKIERKIGSIRTVIGNLKNELNSSFKQLIVEVLKCSENTASRLYGYIVEIVEDMKRNGDDELKLRLEYTKELLEILAGDSES